jgi:hypothetical protein
MVDFSTPGIERFMTLPLDQTEGGEPLMLRQAFRLPEEDEEHLDARGQPWETIVEGGAMWLLLHDFHIPDGYNVPTATLAIRIEAGYPMAALDMCYFYPALALMSGRMIRQTEHCPTIDDKVFQRWSRHYSAENPWRPGIDSVITHLALVEEWLKREVNHG